MQPHQERVVAEKAELDDKIAKLEIFLDGKVFPNLPEDEQARLHDQFQFMTQYSDVLGARIRNF